MHIEHPDTHTHGLCDDCPRCAEYLHRPTGLDHENLRRIWRGDLKTATDMKVYNELYRMAVMAQRMQEAFVWEFYTISDPPPEGIVIDLFKVGGSR